MRTHFFIITVLLLFASSMFVVHAQTDYIPLAPLPNTVPPRCNPLDPSAPKPGTPEYKEFCKSTGSGLPTYLTGLYKTGIAAAGILAVLMLVWGGFQYMTTEAIQGKNESRGIIMNVVWGLATVLASYLLLYTINPRLVDIGLALTNLNSVTKQPPATSVAKQWDDFLTQKFTQMGNEARTERKAYEDGLKRAQALEDAGDTVGAQQVRQETETKRQTKAATVAIQNTAYKVMDDIKNKAPKTTEEENLLLGRVDKTTNDRITETLKAQNKTSIDSSPEATEIWNEGKTQKALVEKAIKYHQCYNALTVAHAQGAITEAERLQRCGQYKYW